MNVVDFPTDPHDRTRRRSRNRRGPDADPPSRVVSVGSLRAEWRSDTGSVRWEDDAGEVPGETAVARLFGGFDLLEWIECLGAPTPEAVVAVPADGRGRRVLEEWPRGHWLEAAPGLWVCGGDDHLLVAPVDPVLRASFRRRVNRT